MAEINQIQLPNETIYDIEDATARGAIDSAVTMTFATVATTGSYDDLTNKPTIPTVPVTDVTVGGSSVVSSGTAVIPAIPAAVEANPTVPSGTTPTSLSGLKIGSGYYDIDAGGGTVTDVTVDGTSVVNASGVAAITTSTVSEISIDSAPTASSTNLVTSGGVKTALDAKQATLVSGTNIKTINNESILGSGNITISGGVTDVRLSDGTSVVSSGIANLPIPSVSSTDNGKVFGVDSGVWSLITPATGVTDVTVGGTSVVSNGTAAVPAIPTVPTISTNITTDANSDVKTASPKAVKTYVDNSISAIPDELPSVSSSDNGKVLMVVSGVWAAATLNTQTYYTGQSTPSSSLGNNGDLYLQIDES